MARLEQERREMLKAANEYASLAVKRLAGMSSGLFKGDRELEEERIFEELQIHFLFPNLHDYERCMLLALKFANKGVSLMVNSEHRSLTEDERRRHETGTREIETLYVDARNQVCDSGLMEKLSPVQSEILQHDFLEIEFAAVE